MNPYLSALSKDRCRVSHLADIYAHVTDPRKFQDYCISSLQQIEPEHVWRPIWILRRAHADMPLSEADLARIVDAIDEPSHWAARLCVCQLFADTGCPESLRDAFFPYLAHAFADRRPIIRAWALSALWTFHADPRFKRAIRRMWKAAHSDRAKSMQARLRRLTVV